MTDIKGEREVSLRFDQFPDRAKDRLRDRITSFVDTLQAAIEGAAPQKTGRLKSEIKGRVYESAHRIAGYVSVYAPGIPGEYAKAATLEYGTSKPRRAFERNSRMAFALGRSKRRIVSRLSKPVHMDPRRYLRGPFADLRGGFEEQIAAALSEAAQDSNG